MDDYFLGVRRRLFNDFFFGFLDFFDFFDLRRDLRLPPSFGSSDVFDCSDLFVGSGSGSGSGSDSG